MTSDDIKRQMMEINLAMKEFDDMFHHWDKHNAEPLVVMSIGLVRFVALAGEMFDSEDAYRAFIHKCVRQGFAVFEESQEEDEGPEYVH